MPMIAVRAAAVKETHQRIQAILISDQQVIQRECRCANAV